MDSSSFKRAKVEHAAFSFRRAMSELKSGHDRIKDEAGRIMVKASAFRVNLNLALNVSSAPRPRPSRKSHPPLLLDLNLARKECKKRWKIDLDLYEITHSNALNTFVKAV